MRMIDVDALINEIKKETEKAIKQDDGVGAFWFGYFAGLVLEQPTIQQENQHGRIFQEIVVEYPSYYIYPEYKGKPYFSIKYTENGKEFIDYGTYKPEVLSKRLKEYFMPSAQPEYELVTAEDFAKTMSENTIYSFMAWHSMALVELMEKQGFVICKKTM